MQTAHCVGVRDSSHAAEARRLAMELASRLSFDDVEAGNVGLVVTEAAKNLLKHAGGGDLMIRALDCEGIGGIEMLAIDKGPGIADIAGSFRDGYSTAGTPGTGLGAIARLSTFHDIYSQPKLGTALLAQLWKRESARRDTRTSSRFEIGAVSTPKTGEEVCGDAWSFRDLPQFGARLLVADGLGHGLLASDAAQAAIRVAATASEDGEDLMARIHAALRPTRGAATAFAEIDVDRGILRYTGIGNIDGRVVYPSGALQHLVSYPGTAGHEVRKIARFMYRWDPGSSLVMHSDGVSRQWSLDKYPGLSRRHPGIIAAVVHRDFAGGRDDATVVVIRERGAAN